MIPFRRGEWCIVTFVVVVSCFYFVESACPFRNVNVKEDIQRILNFANNQPAAPRFGIKNQGEQLENAKNQARENLWPRKKNRLNHLLPCLANEKPKEEKVDPAKLCLDVFDFHTLNEALNDSAVSRKPIMIMICQTWCGACTHLKQKIEKNKYVKELAKVFNMVSLMGDDIPSDQELRPDGSYYPRVLFLSPDGEVQLDVLNEEAVLQKRPHKYYYWDCESLAKSMLTAAKRFLDISEETPEENDL